jgi:hypothetical protein
VYYLPYVKELLNHLASIRELVFVIEGSEMGHHCITLMVILIYGNRAIPITWLVVEGCKGHLPVRLHLQLLAQLEAILLQNCQAISLGDGEFDGIQLQEALQTLGCVMFAVQQKIRNSLKMTCSFLLLICKFALASRSVFPMSGLLRKVLDLSM